MSAEDVIVWALEQRTFDRTPTAVKASTIMREFGFNRYVVVHLPEPSYVDDQGFGFNGSLDDKELIEHGVYAYDGLVYDSYDGWTPEQARTIASWWLAAAEAAEGL